MLSKKVLILVAVMLLTIAGTSYAGTEAGMMELGLQGSYTQTKMNGSDDFKFYLWMVNFGYFFTPQLQIGLMGLVGGTMDGSSDKIYGGSGQFRFNFSFNKAQTVVPYLGVQTGIYGTSNGKSESAFAYGGMAGLKFFMSEKTSLNLEGNWQRTKVASTDIDVFQGLVGVSFYFGK
jgi:opacity protein-like surface antigen